MIQREKELVDDECILTLAGPYTWLRSAVAVAIAAAVPMLILRPKPLTINNLLERGSRSWDLLEKVKHSPHPAKIDNQQTDESGNSTSDRTWWRSGITAAL